MTTHLAHRLPWTALAELYASATIGNGRFHFAKTEAQMKQVAHFARCLVDAVKEFAETDTRAAVDEDGNSLDPKTWDIEPFGSGGYTGYYYSLLGGYVQLNLLLLDADKFLPILQERQVSVPYFIGLLCGHMSGGHPDWMARRLQPILKEEPPFQLKPMTAEVLQTMRDHSALLFRCLYSVSGENKALDPELVKHIITPF
ncbi:hypothetical protein PHMEG_00011222 [Phytophthora megakarya]|uniref:Uncharacterized protein n=1 Tax=Phytophthora megakarya TaxID=4795 RepID=A0A225WCQ7_9STRA|nr:hypothetical protein PHMEG_00011222 [Phytophthora megakarya]